MATSKENENTETMWLDEAQLIEYIENDIIPCANCGDNIDVNDSHRWINRLVCATCLAEYEGLSADDEDNYDSVYEDNNNDDA